MPASVTQAQFADHGHGRQDWPTASTCWAAARANSYMVEFDDFVAVFEAPGNEERSLAVIEQIAKLAPNKPIRWLISSHPHFDHIGGIRTYHHIGATIVTHMKNIDFLNQRRAELRAADGEARHHVAVAADRSWRRATTTRRFRRTTSSPTTRGSCASITCSRCRTSTGMLMAYLPAERIAFEADLFDTHEPPPAPPTPAMTQLLEPGEAHEAGRRDDRAGARPAGAVVDFEKAMGAAAKLCESVGAGGAVAWVPCK